jgi:enterochelin esterase-like enzyme
MKIRAAGRLLLLVALLAAGCSPLSKGNQTSSPTPDLPNSPTLTPLNTYSEAAPVASSTPEPDPSPTLDPEPVEQCWQRTGQVEAFEFNSPRDGEIITGQIFLPPCYQSRSNKDYPVVYLLHGAQATDSQWLDLGAAETAERMIHAGQIQPFIMVFPFDSGTNNPQENPFGEYLVKDLVPWIDSSYRTEDDREQRAVGGISRGGNWAVRLGMLHWGIFSAVGSHSAPLFRGDLSRIPDWLETIPSEMAPNLYLDVSEGDQELEQVRAFEDVLAELGAVYQYHLNPGLHTERYWSSHLEEYLVWYSSQLNER